MKKLAAIFYVMALMMVCFTSNGQTGKSDPVKENIIERFIETISETTEQEIDFTALLEDLNYYYDHPINLNQTKPEELKQLYLLNELQINSLFEYIHRHGPLLSIYEIQFIPGWNDETIYSILPFIDVYPPKQQKSLKLKDIFQYGKHELVARYTQILEKSKGFLMNDTNNTAGYLGDPSQVFFRYRFTYRDRVSVGFVAKKDRGEEFFSGTQPYGFDFYAGHLFLKDIGILKKIAIGDYNLQFGQGLTLWTGFGFRRTALAMNIKRFPSGIRPYTATNQAFFNRGAAAEAKIGPVTVTGFVSYKPLSATITNVDSLTGAALQFSSFYESGLHRTLNELNKKNRIYELLTGGNIMYRAKKWNVGITGVYTHYSAELVLDNQLYNLYRFRGDRLFNIGIDYNWLVGKFYLFGELALDQHGAHAFLQGVQANLSGNFGLSFVIREYSKKYQNMNSNAFGERSEAQNERGVYLGFTANPIQKFNLMGYVDVFQFPWLRYNVDAPSTGYEFLLQATYAPNRRTETYLRIRRSNTQQNSTIQDEFIEPIIDVVRTNYRFNFTFEVSKQLKLKNRIELITLEQPDKPFRWGFLIYQDVVYKPDIVPLDVSARLAVFNTDDFDTRLYAYENDVLYSFSVPAYFYQGMRFYIQAKYEIIKGLSVWFRIAQSYFLNRQTIGSGLDEIDGNTRTEVKVQVRYRFGIHRKVKQALFNQKVD
ncbi:MAG: helix-hairpin-helix domain-containing protein [Flavobacteriales bacterium]|nr:helix-hairpin-helix domain-containing protein [Flavobacteriales bacterium]